MTDFNVYAEIKRIHDDTDLSDPHEISEKLLTDMDMAERAESFVQVAPKVVSDWLTGNRGRSTGQPGDTADRLDREPEALLPEVEPTDVSAGQDSRPAREGDAAPVASASDTPTATDADLIREWYQADLRESYYGAEEWLRLGKFAAADHRVCAERRYEQANKVRYRGEWHEACANAMETYGVAMFEDLPTNVLSNLILQRRRVR